MIKQKLKALLQALEMVANPQDALFMKKYMKNQFDFLGVKTPARRKISKSFLKADRQIDWDFVEQAWQSPYREMQYVVLDYLSLKQDLLEASDLPLLKKLAQTKSWWDTIDYLDTIVGKLSFVYPEIKPILLDWSLDDDFWLRRLAIDHQLLRKEKTDLQLLEQILMNNLNQSEFFINKAIGWALRDLSKTNPAWVRDFIQKHRQQMAKLSIREASKYVSV